MSKSEEIKARLQEANIRYWAGDNISHVLEEGDKEELINLTKINLILVLSSPLFVLLSSPCKMVNLVKNIKNIEENNLIRKSKHENN